MGEVKKKFIPNNNLKLEIELYLSSNNNTDVILLTHPHPLYGGNMYNNVVSGIFNKFKNEDINSIRFNFRGVGNSEGRFSNKVKEITDVQAILNYLIQEKNFKKIVICGYSYGAAVGCSCVNELDEIIGFIAISFPWDFMGPKYKNLSQTDKFKLFIQGDKDSIADFKNFEEHYKFYKDPKKKIIIHGADHFYRGYENEISQKVHKFFQEIT